MNVVFHVLIVFNNRRQGADIQSDDQAVGHIGGLLHVQRVQPLQTGRSDQARGQAETNQRVQRAKYDNLL